MKKLLFGLVLVFGLVACQKHPVETPDTVNLFEYAGQEYASLQDAFNAIANRNADEDTDESQSTIKFISCGKGAGAVMPAQFAGPITLDLNGHNYEVSEGVIDLGKADVTLASNDGSISGELKLSGGKVFIAPSSKNIGISVLRVGKDSYVSIEDRNATGKILNIGTLYSDEKYPVRAFEASTVSVGSGASAHIHKMDITRDIDADCLHHSGIESECSECGQICRDEDPSSFGYCHPEDLEHIEAKASTATDNGFHEHWRCIKCGEVYSDAQGKHLFDGPVTILADNYCLDPNLLHALDGEIYIGDGHQNDALAVIGIVLSVAGLLETLGLSIPGMTGNDEEVMQQLSGKMDQMNSNLDRIDSKLNNILQRIKDVPYITEINQRWSNLVFLEGKSIPAYNLIEKYRADKSMSDEQKQAAIENVLKIWASETFGGTSTVELTRSLIKEFYTPSVDGPAYLGKIEHVMDGVFPWEHQAYDTRGQIIERDFAILSTSYILAGTYINDLQYSDKAYAELQLKDLKDAFKKMKEAIEDDVARMQFRGDEYRRFSAYDITFDRKIKPIEFFDWFKSNWKKSDVGFPRLNQDGKAVKNCNKMLSDLGLTDKKYITQDMAKDIYNSFGKQDLYVVLKDSLGFQNITYVERLQSGKDAIFTYKEKSFESRDGDSALPAYNIFSWDIYRSSNYNDSFGVRTCLKKDANTCYRNIMFKCDISSYSSGVINSLGTKDTNFFTIIQADTQ